MDIEAVVFDEEVDISRAQEVASDSGAPLVPMVKFNDMDFAKDSYLLYLGRENFELRKNRSREKGVFVNFFSKDIIRRIKTGSVKSPMCRALGLKGNMDKELFILDGTAGLGRDSVFLNHFGARVAGFERNPVIYHLLEKGYENYLKSFNSVHSQAENISFFNLDTKIYFGDKLGITDLNKKSLERFREFSKGENPDVVYLDPMYPPRKKKSAKPKKEMLFLKDISGDDKDSRDLFLSCLNKNLKIVVKRPVYAEHISDIVKPDYKVESKLVRYDVYL